MSNIMLLDTNFSSGPIYKFLVESGHNVTVVGGNPNDSLAKPAENYVNVDYSDVDKTRELIDKRNIDFLVPGCNDLSYMVCAEINCDGRFPGIDTIETANIINNKEKFRNFSAENDMPVPQVLKTEDIGSRWPVIVKPVDAFSGRGVTVINESNKNELASAISYARRESRTDTHIVEDYVDGQLYSHTAFFQDGKIIIDHIVEEHGTASPFAVDTSRVSYDFPEKMQDSIRSDICLLAIKLALCNGLIHTQFISNGTEYWLIEITRRCPGDMYSQLIELSTGTPFAENYVKPFIGMKIEAPNRSMKNMIMRHTITDSEGCILGSIRFNLPIRIVRWTPISVTGDRLRAAPQGRAAVFFAECSDTQEFSDIYGATLSRNLYSISDY